jgi:hypothetical protein
MKLLSSDAQVIGTHKYSKTFFHKWIAYAGPIDWFGVALDEDILSGLKDENVSCATHTPTDVDACKRMFLETEFNSLVTRAVQQTTLAMEDSDTLAYMRILLGACIRFDPTLCAVCIVELYWYCNLLLKGEVEVPAVCIDSLYDMQDLMFACFSFLCHDDTESFIANVRQFKFSSQVASNILNVIVRTQ